MAKTTADLLIERRSDRGVDTIFGFPSDGINGIFEALRMLGKIKTQQALHVAEALARGEKDRVGIIKDVLMDKVREVM